MDVVIFGATGMVGQGVLRECLLDAEIGRVVTVGRSATGQSHPKLLELVVPNVADLSSIEGELAGLDACFFAVGVTSAGLSEADYTKLTHGLTVDVANTLVRLNPRMTFVFVSGTGADSTEAGRVMWARIKGKAENALLKMPFRAVYVFRPAVIIPRHGIRSRTRLYRVGYVFLAPLLPVIRALAPNFATTTERLGRAMIAVARNGYAKHILEAKDINQVSVD
ncbi:MAG TPA: hypothetical protein VFE05_09325 [Longimicrobiaceae bacterium]|jgi:uncharacterized protein YbjT (DUF2867 family)|nr:hypothetical protein [Longimicrobiaceae bacterium]